jgi:hypothetical protein
MIGSSRTIGAWMAGTVAADARSMVGSTRAFSCGKEAWTWKMHGRAVTTMNRVVLPTKHPSSGFWAVSERNGYDARSLWVMASNALANVFALNPVEVREFLDGDAGHLLADDINFIEGGPTGVAAIEALINARLRHAGWQRLYRQAISHIRRSRRADHARPLHR